MTSPTYEFEMSYEIGSETHILNGYDGYSGYTFNLLEFSDVGLPPIQRISQKGAFQHGDTNVDFRLQPRTFSIRGLIEANNSFEHMKARNMLSKIFKVNNTAGTIQIKSKEQLNEPPYTTTIVYRSIDCYVEGGLNFSSDTSSGYDVYYEVSLKASNPLWYDPVQKNFGVTNSIAGNPTDIPGLIPREYGSLTLNTSTNVTYDGTFLAYPEFIIYGGDGGIMNLAIYNSTQGTVIRITEVPALATYTVNLRYGAKTVIDQNNAVVTYVVDPASNLTTFALVTSVDSTSKSNTIIVESSSASSGAYVIMLYYNQYTAV